MIDKIRMFLKDEEGSNAAEYALILALIALAIIVGAGLLGTAVNTKLTTASTTIDAAAPGGG
jgi:pilus assembly protein Flp/PilA